MTEEFTIQCQSCGTIYNDLQDVCPYCGDPQLAPTQFVARSHRDQDSEEVSIEDPDSEPYGYEAHAQPNHTADEAYTYEAHEEVDQDAYYSDHPYSEGELPGDDYPDQQPLPGEALYDEDYPPGADPYSTANDFSDADIVRRADEIVDESALYDDSYDTYHQDSDHPYAFRDGDYADQEEYLDPEYAGHPADPAAPDSGAESGTSPQRFTWRRMLLGCTGTLICIGLLYGGIALLAVREGLTERAEVVQTESEEHYQKGQDYLANDQVELAIAEFELAISINPNLLPAREALREAKQVLQLQPTATSETRSAAAADLLVDAQAKIESEAWAEAAQTLSQVRDLDPEYQADLVSELTFTANYELALQLIRDDQFDEALEAFEVAQIERPDDDQIAAEKSKALLYQEGTIVERLGGPDAIEAFSQLYQEDEDYLDVKQRLRQAYETYGDELVEDEEWCLAEIQFTEAETLRSSSALQIKIEKMGERCQEDVVVQRTRPAPRATPTAASRPTVAAPAAETEPAASVEVTVTAEVTETVSAPSRGTILFSAYNPFESSWEIHAVPAGGGASSVIAVDATMPSLSPNAKLLLYHSELVDSEGLHILDLTTGQDSRVTRRKEHVLPKWRGDDDQFIFVAQEPGTGRWLVHQGFADGKSDPIILRDGRTPDWSSGGNTVAFQGTNAQGNDPGIYVVPFGGGETVRLTEHESDRSPAFSPNGAQLAYMSTQNGNWDIYTVNTAGGTPRQLTTYPGNDGLPAWSPDGSQLAYVSDSGGSWAIYTIPASGGTPKKIIEWDGTNRADWLMAQIWWGS